MSSTGVDPVIRMWHKQAVNKKFATSLLNKFSLFFIHAGFVEGDSGCSTLTTALAHIKNIAALRPSVTFLAVAKAWANLLTIITKSITGMLLKSEISIVEMTMPLCSNIICSVLAGFLVCVLKYHENDKSKTNTKAQD